MRVAIHSAGMEHSPEEMQHIDHPQRESVDGASPIDRVEDYTEATPEDDQLELLIGEGTDTEALADAVGEQDAADAADTLERLHEEQAAGVLVVMESTLAAEALAEMEAPLAVGVLQDLLDESRVSYAATLLERMADDDAADLLQELSQEDAAHVLGKVETAKALVLRRLVGYPEESAGGIMTLDALVLQKGMTVGDAVDAIREADIPDEMHELPVIDARNLLQGMVSLRALLLSRHDVDLVSLVQEEVHAVPVEMDRESVAHAFDRYDFSILPVIDGTDHFLGIITVDDVIDIIREEETEDVQQTVGAGREEAVYSSLSDKFRGRFPWLMISVFLMLPAAWIVLQFEGLIGDLVILAMVMPMVAALAGTAGHQSLAVTLRGIVLDEVRPDLVVPHLRRELLLGICSGSCLGLLLGLGMTALGTVVESSGWRLGVVVAISMAVSMSAGTIAGATIPLLMKRMGFDPAQGSAIFLVMITDAIAFATFLGLSALTLGWLQASTG